MRFLLAQRKLLIAAAAVAAVLFGLGITFAPQPPPALPTPGIAGPGHAYSPFAVRVSGHPAFGVVTFKRVGSNIPERDDPSYEEVAESLAMSLTDGAVQMAHEQGYDGPGDLATEVVYTPALLDPKNHVFCDAHHLYVDYWSTEEDGWGYSLWSGCGAEDRFALTEVAPSEEDAIQALTRHITETLRSAAKRGCYQRAC